jgi:hypothetical protein
LVIASTVAFLLALLVNLLETVVLSSTGAHPEIPHWLEQRYLFLAAWGFLRHARSIQQGAHVGFPNGPESRLPDARGIRNPGVRSQSAGGVADSSGVGDYRVDCRDTFRPQSDHYPDTPPPNPPFSKPS